MSSVTRKASSRRERTAAAGGFRRKLRRHRAARLGAIFLGMLFLLAVLAPFLANRFPLLMIREDRLSFPALQAFAWDDVLWSAGGMLVVIRLVMGRLRPPPRGRIWRIGFALAAALVVSWAAFARPVNLAVVDHRALERAGATCVWAPVPHGWRDQDERTGVRHAPPGRFPDHPLGTDGRGRDVLARLLFGARVSLLVGVLAVGMALAIGTLVGALAGYVGGPVDAALSWLIQVVMCFPVLFAVMVLQIFLPPGILWVVLLLGLVRWTGMARLMRAEVRRLRGEDFILAARVQGLSSWRIIRRHLIPNALAPVLVNATFAVAAAILLESALSFLGLGVPPPAPSWGEMLSQGREALSRAPHLVLLPGTAIFLTVLAVNLLGEGVRQALDPRHVPAEEAGV